MTTNNFYSLPFFHSDKCRSAYGVGGVYVCTDETYCKLIADVMNTASAYEAFTDGAIGLVTDVDREHARLSREYDRASRALIEYRRANAK